MQGTLYIVATPIGNLEDITLRALRILKEVSRIACEDTRHTRRLLDHFGIQKSLISFHEHNERERISELLDWLRCGDSLALVSDAGTPLVSDPGYRLVEAAIREGLPVVTVPGPSAVIAALSGSGLPTDSFYFGGFLPAKPGQRQKTLRSLAELDCVLIFFEAPHRIVETLEDIALTNSRRQVVLARELTKIHEEFLRGDAASLLTEISRINNLKGEITLLLGKPSAVDPELASIGQIYLHHLNAGLDRMEAMKATARDCGVSKRAVYAELEKKPMELP